MHSPFLPPRTRLYFLRAASSKPHSTVHVRQGNVYPTLIQEQMDMMRQRRLTSNCAPDQLRHKEPAAHQAKHIMLCRWGRSSWNSYCDSN